MKKRALSMLLAAVMLLSLLPVQALASGANSAPAAPADLTWGNGQGFNSYGDISWREIEGAEHYDVELYQDGKLIFSLSCMAGDNVYGDGRYHFPASNYMFESAAYVAKVRTIGGSPYTQNSEWVESSPFQYTRPSQALELPTNLAVDREGVVTWTPSESNKSHYGNYMVDLYEQRTPGGKWIVCASASTLLTDEGRVEYFRDLFFDSYREPGTYGIKIFAASANIQDVAHSPVSDMLTFEYGAAPETVSVELDKSALIVAKDGSASLTAAPQPETAQVSWSSSNPDVATVDQQGNVKAVSFGTAKITATASQDGQKASASCDVTVPGVVFEQDDVYYPNQKASYSPKYQVYPAGKQVVWSGGNAEVATVFPETGTISVVGPGNTTIGAAVTVTGTDGKSITAISGCKVTVFNCYLEQSELTIQKGQSKFLLLCAESMPQGFEVVTKTSDSKVAAVKEMEVTAVGAGTATVTVTIRLNGKDLYSMDCAVTVPGIRLDKNSVSLSQGKTEQLTADVTPKGSTVTWSSSNPGVASVSQTGLVTAVSPGQAEVTANIRINETDYFETCIIVVSNIDLSNYKWGKSSGINSSVNVAVIAQNVEERDRRAFVDAILKTSLADADKETQNRITDHIYNVMFNATYRPQVFGGSQSDIKKFPIQNYLYKGEKAPEYFSDKGLGFTAKHKNFGGYGCLAYVRASSYYIYGTSRTTHEQKNSSFKNAESVRNFLQTYIDPGEGLYYYRGAGQPHALLYLGEDSKSSGFFFLSYGGGLLKSGGNRYDAIELGYIKYSDLYSTIKKAPSETLYVYDYNSTHFSSSLISSKIELHCPIEIIVTVDGETLDSRGVIGTITGVTGALTATGEGQDRNICVTIQGQHKDFDIELLGTNRGEMSLSVTFSFADGTTDTRSIHNIPVSATSKGSISNVDPAGTTTLQMSNSMDKLIVWNANPNEVILEPNGEFPYVIADYDDTTSSDSDYSYSSSADNISKPNVWRNPFTDVTSGDWFCDAVRYVYENGLMSGTGADIFSPGLTTTRGMAATILYQLEGVPKAGVSSFTDVGADRYYAQAVSWAAEQGIISGYGGGRFGPEDPVTREQLAAILYRYAAFKGSDTSARSDLSAFADSAQLADYAVVPMGWAVSQQILSGRDGGILDPQGNATRAEAAAMLLRLHQLLQD